MAGRRWCKRCKLDVRFEGKLCFNCWIKVLKSFTWILQRLKLLSLPARLITLEKARRRNIELENVPDIDKDA